VTIEKLNPNNHANKAPTHYTLHKCGDRKRSQKCAPWLKYNQTIADDMVNASGIFSDCTINFKDGKYTPKSRHRPVERERWRFAEFRRPAIPHELKHFNMTLVDPLPPQFTMPSTRNAAYAALNVLCDMRAPHTLDAAASSHEKVDSIFRANTQIDFFNLDAISKLPAIHTSVGQLATAEFFASIVDIEFTYRHKITTKGTTATDAKMEQLIIVSKTLRNLVPGCCDVTHESTSELCDAGFNYGKDLTREIGDLFRFLCTSSYSVAKNNPDGICGAHEIEQQAFYESDLFRHIIRYQSIANVGINLYETRRIWDDERLG